MSRWMSAVAGAAAFGAAHAVEAAGWARWFGGAHPAWFLNSGRAIAFTAAVMAAAAAVVTATRPRDVGVLGTFAAGSIACMLVVFVMTGGLSGTIFPIVLVTAVVVLLASTVAGGAIVSACKKS